jgi:hypothetical protein
MKTRKLLFLVAGFMLFALTAQAQQQLTNYSMTVTNVNLPDIQLQFDVQAITPEAPGTDHTFWLSVATGQTSRFNKGIYQLLSDPIISISALGYRFSISLSELSRFGGVQYTQIPGVVILVYCVQTGNHWDMTLVIQ